MNPLHVFIKLWTLYPVDMLLFTGCLICCTISFMMYVYVRNRSHL